MYLGELVMSQADAASLGWNPVTYRDSIITGGVNDVTVPRTYVEPSGPWYQSVGFKGSNQRIPINVPMVQEGYGEQAQMRPGVPSDPRALYLVTDAVNEKYGWFTTPIIQEEKARGLTQQVAYRGSMRYYRYVDRNGKQVGDIAEFSAGGDALVGRIVKVLAVAMIGAGVAQAAGAAAKAAGSALTPTAPAAASVAPTAAAGAAPTVAAGGAAAGGGGLVSAGGALSTVAKVGSALSTAAPIVAKAAPIVAGVVKAKSDAKAKEALAKAQQDALTRAQVQLPIAPPADMLSPGAASQYTHTFESRTPSWLVPAVIGGGALLFFLLGKQRSRR